MNILLRFQAHAKEGFSVLLMQKKEAYKILTKEQERFWKRILIVDDNVDITVTFKTAIEDNNNTALTKKIEVHTSNNPVMALSEFKQNCKHILLHMVIRNVKILLNYQYYGSSCSSRNLLSRLLVGVKL